MRPEISIIIPAYNAALWISETLRSIQAQTFSNWEVLVVDDGSTDETAELVRSFANDQRIYLIQQVNAGVATARNTGIEQAKGEFITFLDADDWWLPECLQEKRKTIREHPVDFVFSDMKRFWQTNQTYSETVAGTDENMLEHLLLWDKEVIPTPTSNLLIRRTSFDAGMRFDPQFSTAADQDFTFRLCANYSGKRIAQTLLVYRILPTSMSRNIAQLETDHLAVYRKAARLNLFKTASFRRKCFANLYLMLAGNWWVNGGKKIRSLGFMLRAVCIHPPVLTTLVPKLFRRNHS